MLKFISSRKMAVLLSLFFVVIITLVQTNPISLSELTQSQLEAVEELRARVKNDLPPHDYMKDDAFLLRFLIARNFDVDKAHKLLQENLVWREANNIDGIFHEDWKEIIQQFPFKLDKVDKEGQPILYFKFGEWDIRSMSISGMLPRLNRYFYRMFEEADQKIWTMRAQGSNVTQFKVIMNMDGFSTTQHACILCLPFYANVGRTMEANYAGGVDKAYMINTPRSFEVVLKLLTAVLSRQSRQTLKIYGTERKEWEPVLLEVIDREQFPGDI